MKKLISILSLVFVAGLLSVNGQCCSHSTSDCGSHCSAKATTSKTNTDVQAYYFHGTRRCATCQAVESVTRDAISEYYGDKIDFRSLNVEKDKDNPMIEKYKINGQTLLIIKGDKVVDLTNDAFLNARTNPDKLKEKIKETVDSMI